MIPYAEVEECVIFQTPSSMTGLRTLIEMIHTLSPSFASGWRRVEPQEMKFSSIKVVWTDGLMTREVKIRVKHAADNELPEWDHIV